MRDWPQVCARCRHWTQIYQGPVSDWEEPGACRGMVGKLARWNGMWTKAGDGCESWQLSPERANVDLQLPIPVMIATAAPEADEENPS
jgi:hypothetical protein